MHIAIIDDQAATRQATTKLLSQLTTPTQPLRVTTYPTQRPFFLLTSLPICCCLISS